MVDLSYLKRNVFPGESGGDYNALFGYSQRPGGQFAGVNLTDMTVDQALQFAAPSGPYGQWVKGQVGRVATPMGAYQVVGSTLRAAKEGLGLTGNERMTPELQDQIGQWIYQTQGPSAWEAWGKGSSTGDTGMVRGGAGQTSMAGQAGADFLASEQERPRGLLGGFFGPEGRDRRARLAIALEGMTLNPNQALIGELQRGLEQRETTSQKNRTLDYLRSLGTPQAKEALRYAEGTGDIVGALKMATSQPEQTALMQNVQWLMSQGVPMNEALQTARSGSVVNVDTKSASKFEEEFAKGDAKTIGEVYATGLQAARNISRIDQLETLLSTAPSGAEGAIKLAAGELGVNTEGLSDIQAAQAIINSLVPEQRQPGSGPMSDADLALFKQSLPRIINQPGGNQLIIQTMRGIAQYDAEGAAIVQRLRSGEIDRATAFELLQNRQNPLANFRGAAGTGPGGGGNQPVVIDGVTIRKVN